MPRKLAVVPELDSELDTLYAAPLEEFTSLRNALATRLRKAGQGEAADSVKALHKPSVAVWAVNQLARTAAQDVATLLDAGEALRTAQATALRGDGGDRLREATSAERAAVRTLRRRAQALLEASGRAAPQALLDRIGATMRTAAIDTEAAALLRAGRLSGELESSGFALAASLAPPAPARRRTRTPPTREQERRAREAARRKQQAQVERLERAAREAEDRATRAEEAAEDARRRAAAARAEASKAAEELATRP